MPLRYARKPRRASRKPRKPVRSTAVRPSRPRPAAKRSMPMLKRKAIAPQRVRNTGGMVSQSLCRQLTTKRTAMPAVARQIKLIGMPNFWESQSAKTDFPSLSGQQEYGYYDHCLQYDLVSIRNKLPSYSALTGNGTPARYVLESYQSELLFTNTCTAPLELELFDIYCKRDVTTGYTYTTPSGTNTYSVQGNPASYWQVGACASAGISAGNLGGPTDPSLAYGATPFDSQLFKDFFGVSKRTIVMLPQGAIHRHVNTQKINYVVNDSLVLNTQEAATQGLGHFTLYVIKGFPSSAIYTPPPTEGLEASPPVPTTTTPIVQLSSVQSRRYKFTWSADLTTNLSNETKLFNNSGFQPQIVNIGSGAIDSVTQRTAYA